MVLSPPLFFVAPPLPGNPPLTPPLTVVALTPCWFTRQHLPAHGWEPEEEGPFPAMRHAFHARCRHCHRDITSLNARDWQIAGGFDAEAAGHKRALAFLSVVDVLEELVLARFPIGAIADEAGVRALRRRLEQRYGMDDPGSTLMLRDSRDAAALPV